MTDENIQNLSTDVTIHMFHTLQQYAKGHITGTNTKGWKNHILANSRLQIHYTIVTVYHIVLSN